MRVAVVGSGISGLTAAYYLRALHDVHVYESEDQAGGHACTIPVKESKSEFNLDTGFMVYNKITYPGFSNLVEELGVEIQDSDMSFGVACSKCNFEYGNRGLQSMLAQPSALLRPSWTMIPFQIRRFYKNARSLILNGDDETSLDQFLLNGKYSNEIIRHLIIPLVASVWTTPAAEVGSFPAKYLFEFMDNHCMLSFTERRVWQTIKGGSQNYVDSLVSHLPYGVHLNTTVTGINRDASSVTLSFKKHAPQQFDAVILATHSDQSLRMLSDPSEFELKALGGIKYSESNVYLHTDDSVMPKRARAWCSWNYRTDECASRPKTSQVTYHLNRLQKLESTKNYFVSLNMGDQINDKAILSEFKQSHPMYRKNSLESQSMIQALNASNSPTFFAGAYLGHGFHEDGFQSGLFAANSLMNWSKAIEF
tara:strand:- start:2973 stop:4241 length:1269 start_codon:yes stop_codon:yes gene_type:complete